MKETATLSKHAGRKAGAWACLAALILLWSPLWVAAWESASADCCAEGMCAVSGRAHHNHTKNRSASENSMHCEHQPDSLLGQCSVSCFKDINPSVTTAAIFVMPTAIEINKQSVLNVAATVISASEFAQKIDLLSPPPRV